MSPLLEIEGLHVDLLVDGVPRPVLHETTVSLDAGEALGLVGESGAGKSMTVRAIMRLLPPGATVRGRILYEGSDVLAFDREIMILIEPKPNEPMDHAFLPTIGHAIGLSYLTDDPTRVGGLIESAHALLAGLDPSEEMAYALYHKKLWSVHLNDQNGLKYDEDKSFGGVDLRRAFNQVRVLDENGYGRNGEFVGLDVKAMRTQPFAVATRHLSNSRAIFLALLDKVRSFDRKKAAAAVAARDYELLEMQTIKHLLCIK